MPTWLVLFAIILVCLTVLMFVKRDKYEGFGMFKDQQMTFANDQYTYFHDTADKGIFTNPGLNLNGLNDAMAQPDLYLAKSPGRDYTSYFAEDPENAYTSKDKTFCKNAISPRDLPRRESASKVACGWYYVSNSATPSVGALGTRDGPLFPKGLPANGEWIWDIPTAIMKEDIKACKRVKSCDLISVEGIRGKCGFCERLGHAIPINYDGSEKYPNSDDGSCGQYTVKEASACFKEPVKPIVTSDGINCGTYGYPSPDNSTRLYKKDECDALNGTFSANGECLIKKGGSYSWSCRTLNNPVKSKKAAVAVSVCAPAANGRLSRQCLQSLASGLGYSKSGAVLRLLSTSNAPGETDRLAIEQLKSAGYAVPDAILGSGDIESQSAANLYQKLYEAMARGTSTIVRQAAQWMVTGTDTFDVCAIDANSTGPFPTACIQRAFRMAGCQASGLKNPTEQSALEYANMTWGDVNNEFSTLYDSMKSSKSTEQDAAVKDCLGFAYARPPPPRCDYTQTLGGYDEGSGVGQVCFTTTLKNAKDTCAGMPGCRSFSFANKPNLSDTSVGFGCYKMDNVGFNQNSSFTGFTKIDKPLNEYQLKGCYNDSPNRALPVYAGNGKTVASCKQEAEKRNMNTFGLQYYGECWLGNDVDYAKYGPTNSCGNLGGAWSQNVYKKGGADMTDFSASPLVYNGNRIKPSIEGRELKLLSQGAGAVSAFMMDKQPITNFYTSFTVRFASNRADGMTFCIQNQSVNALGGTGGYLGVQGINPGVAIRLDNYYGPDGRLSVGFIPTTTAVSSTGSGYQDLAESGDITGFLGLEVRGDWVLNVEIKYSNNNLIFIVSNAKNPQLSYARSMGNIDLPRLVGGNTAWMGFTAGTGGLSADIFVSNWKVTDQTLPEKWVRIGVESYPTVSVAPNTQVRYGYGDRWVNATKSGVFNGNSTTFGDPYPGVLKEIQAFL